MGIDLVKGWGKRWSAALPEVILLLCIGTIMALNIKISILFLDLKIGIWIFAGLALGWLLSLTKWPAGFSALYGALSGLALVIQHAYHVLPSIHALSGPYLVWSEEARLRVVLFSQRVVNWALILLNGNPIKDPFFEQMAYPFVSLLCAAWMAWWILKRKNVLLASIPIGLFFLFYVWRWDKGSEVLVMFLAVIFLAVAFMAYRRCQSSWDQRGVDWPYLDSLLPEWLTGSIFITILVIFTGLAVPTLATPEGWQKIGEALKAPPSQAVSPAARPQSAGGEYPQITREPQVSIIIGTPSLDVIGQPPTLSQTVLFWVYVSDPPPPPVEAGEELFGRSYYWRSGIFDEYTGSGWVEAPLNPADAAGMDKNRPPGRYVLEQRFEIMSAHANTLLGMNMPFQARDEVELVFTHDGSPLVRGSQTRYTLLSWAADMTVSQLNEAGQVYPPIVSETYLALPDDIPQRVIQLAENIVATASTPYEKAIKVQDYLRSNYQYTLDVPLPPEGQDVVDYFLFDAPGGFCSYYASAMAVLLRLEGVPARVVSGFANGEFDYARGGYRVPASAAHAWVEVYFPGYGWVEFEPTSAYQAIVRPTGDVLKPDDQNPTAPLMRRWNAKAIVGLGAIVTAALVIYLFLKMKRITPIRIKTSDPVERLYWRLRQSLSLVDIQASGTFTPHEFQNIAHGRLAGQPNILRLLESVTLLYVKTMFSPRRPEKREIAAAKAEWRAALPEFTAIWVRSLAVRAWIRIKKIFIHKSNWSG